MDETQKVNKTDNLEKLSEKCRWYQDHGLVDTSYKGSFTRSKEEDRRYTSK